MGIGQDSGMAATALWVIAWGLSGFFMNVFLKSLMSPQHQFQAIASLTVLHFVFQSLVLRLLFFITDRFGTLPQPTGSDRVRLAALGVFIAAEVAFGNAAFAHLSLGCMQIFKNGGAVCAYFIAVCMSLEKFRCKLLLSILVVFIGLALTISDVRPSVIGVALIAIATLAMAFKGVFMQLNRTNFKGMQQMTLSQPYAALVLLPYCLYSEFPRMDLSATPSSEVQFYVVMTCILSVVLVLSTFKIAEYTSATTLMVLGNARSVGLVLWGAFMMGEIGDYSVSGWVGAGLALVGVGVYSHLRRQSKSEATTKSSRPPFDFESKLLSRIPILCSLGLMLEMAYVTFGDGQLNPSSYGSKFTPSVFLSKELHSAPFEISFGTMPPAFANYAASFKYIADDPLSAAEHVVFLETDTKTEDSRETERLHFEKFERDRLIEQAAVVVEQTDTSRKADAKKRARIEEAAALKKEQQQIEAEKIEALRLEQIKTEERRKKQQIEKERADVKKKAEKEKTERLKKEKIRSERAKAEQREKDKIVAADKAEQERLVKQQTQILEAAAAAEVEFAPSEQEMVAQAQPSKNLFFISASDNHEVDDWLKCGSADFHTLVSYYGKKKNFKVGHSSSVVHSPDVFDKYEALARILQQDPQLFDKYEFIAVFDGHGSDRMSTGKINALFMTLEDMHTGWLSPTFSSEVWESGHTSDNDMRLSYVRYRPWFEYLGNPLGFHFWRKDKLLAFLAQRDEHVRGWYQDLLVSNFVTGRQGTTWRFIYWYLYTHDVKSVEDNNRRFLPSDTDIRWVDDHHGMMDMARDIGKILEGEGVCTGAYKALINYRAIATRNNIWRAMVLWAYGGMYGDHKMKLLVPISSFLDLEKDTLLFPKDHNWGNNGISKSDWPVQNSFLYSIPRHPILAAVLRLQVERATKHFYPRTDLELSGPVLYHQAWKAHKSSARDLAMVKSYLPGATTIQPVRNLMHRMFEQDKKKGFRFVTEDTNITVVETEVNIYSEGRKISPTYGVIFRKHQVFCDEKGPDVYCKDASPKYAAESEIFDAVVTQDMSIIPLYSASSEIQTEATRCGEKLGTGSELRIEHATDSN